MTNHLGLSETSIYQYGIARASQVVAGEAHEIHREGMTVAEAQDWLHGWVGDGGRQGMFVIVRRPLGTWEVFDV